MNWKRGLFRLWVFLSVLWVAFIGSIAILESSPMRADVRPASNALDFSSSGTLIREQTALEFLSEDVQATDEKPLDVSGLTPLRAEGPTGRLDAERFLDEGPTEVRDWNLPEWRAMAVIIGVPVLALGLGAAIAWIISGFGNSRENNGVTRTAP